MSRPLVRLPGAGDTPANRRAWRYADFQRLTDKLFPRLASTNDAEALGALRAVTKAMEGLGIDWNDLAESIKELGIASQKPPAKPKTWGELSTGERFTVLRDLSAAPWLTADERGALAGISDQFCLTPARHSPFDMEQFMDTLMRRAERQQGIHRGRVSLCQ